MKRLLTSIALAVAMAVPAMAQAQEIVRTGIALSLTGNLADSATHYWRDRVNASSGLLGKKVEFVIYDDRSDAATAARLLPRSANGCKRRSTDSACASPK